MGAEALLDESGPGVERAFYTDSTSVPGFVLIGIAIRGRASATAIVPTKDYDGFKLAALIQRPLDSIDEQKLRG